MVLVRAVLERGEGRGGLRRGAGRLRQMRTGDSMRCAGTYWLAGLVVQSGAMLRDDGSGAAPDKKCAQRPPLSWTCACVLAASL